MNRPSPRAAVVVSLLASVLVAAGTAPAADRSGPAMTEAAQKFLAALDDAARATATMPFDDPRRLVWHHVHKPKR